MGYMCHHAILVSAFGEEINKAHKKAIKIFESSEHKNLVSPIVESSYGTNSFFIAPDGSKEGWNGSNEGDEKRSEFLSYLKSNHYFDWVLIQYGDDEQDNRLLDSN